MPAHITLSALGFSTPDGTQLFSNLDLAFSRQRTGLVGRNGVGKSTLFRLVTGTLTPQSGSVTIDGTIGLLRQSLKPGPGETIADLFGATAQLTILARAASGTATADELADADWTIEARIDEALARFSLPATADTPLATLSGGQRTRAMLAALVFADPDFLLLDEPTNNLDHDGRDAVIDLLANWRGGAIVVSHDRELLETMDAIVELTSLGATTYGGNYSLYRERKSIELAAAEHDLANAEKRTAQVEKKAQQTRERQQKSDAGGKRKRAKGDLPKILLNGRKNAAENSAGENARLASRLRQQAESDAQTAREKIEVLKHVTISLPPTNLPTGKKVLTLDAVSAGYDPATPILRDVSLAITGPERVAITGPNGSGKTTLLRLVSGTLEPCAGTVSVQVPHALLDQQVSILDPQKTVRDNFLALNPASDENACRAALARFKFRADAALKMTASLSGGETLRAGLACALGTDTPPQLLVLDEPTNHLDLESIEAVEVGLRGYDGALLVVSHDRPFLEAIAVTREISLA
ncbi:ABC-F family ATP-binding cassette domain-containing protein [Pelagibacterium halotolerans]|uniref:Putative ABC transporter, ATP-binding protein n=1 Tax=Pelagibacterium halotolerans (strain DSM 22347 / JCM 15775 / CGMCC 1.7692 / B2) TaxID=1082931 RepID=G4REB5_PELHB|nr:ABC-F family ATP-binding cassette domain-containing protein [Pelagibacterium halotolerans]AEQ51879.1 putative ABC transporter, ATP-binding protein [Pelagibacterium halotolerans B2]QJR18317.1 ABC-F family ATP-binding cassette domain-containing protein [Pelagibacterium halotolerans]SEA25860.1 ATPase components of ABC transporters with duplicated ATPase domains [Pelagibacterium halotolerans]